VLSRGDTQAQTRLGLGTEEGEAFAGAGGDFPRSNSQDVAGLYAINSKAPRRRKGERRPSAGLGVPKPSGRPSGVFLGSFILG